MSPSPLHRFQKNTSGYFFLLKVVSFAPQFTSKDVEHGSVLLTIFLKPKILEFQMKELNLREHELVALGAAVACNCVPCIEFHIPEARKAGLTDAQILEAVLLSDKIKQVPSRKILEVAQNLLNISQPECSASSTCGCGAAQSSDSCNS